MVRSKLGSGGRDDRCGLRAACEGERLSADEAHVVGVDAEEEVLEVALGPAGEGFGEDAAFVAVGTESERERVCGTVVAWLVDRHAEDAGGLVVGI